MKYILTLLLAAFLCSCDKPADPTIDPPVAAPEEDKGSNEGDKTETDSEYYIVDGIDDPMLRILYEIFDAAAIISL